jgi:hypothetical protein
MSLLGSSIAAQQPSAGPERMRPSPVRFLQALRENRIQNGVPAGLGIAGGSGGMNTIVEGGLPGGYDLIVLANLDPPAAERVVRMTREWLGVHDDDGGG